MLYKLPAFMRHERIHQIAGRHAKFSLRERERERSISNHLLLSYHNKSREYGASDRLHLLELILSVRLDSGLCLQGLYMSTSLIRN